MAHVRRDGTAASRDPGRVGALVRKRHRRDRDATAAHDPRLLHLELGARLAPLRERGVLIVGSGNIVHNLRALNWQKPDYAFDWARRFDDAARTVLTERPSETPALRNHSDYARSAPTPDHFIPLLYIAGLASVANRPLELLVDGHAYGSISMASYTLDADCPIERGDTRPAAVVPDPTVVPSEDTNL
jgi:4,5-DOPA dioxygenase extradiol